LVFFFFSVSFFFFLVLPLLNLSTACRRTDFPPFPLFRGLPFFAGLISGVHGLVQRHRSFSPLVSPPTHRHFFLSSRSSLITRRVLQSLDLEKEPRKLFYPPAAGRLLSLLNTSSFSPTPTMARFQAPIPRIRPPCTSFSPCFFCLRPSSFSSADVFLFSPLESPF